MHHCLTVHIYQSPSNIFELPEAILLATGSVSERNKNPTSASRFASQCALINSLMFPLTIHSDTIVNWLLFIVTPKRDNTFRWRRAFHVTTSLQNLYMVSVSRSTCALQEIAWAHPCNLDKVACHVYLQHLDCNVPPLVFTFPYFSKPAMIQRGIHSVVAKWDLH